MHTIDEIRNMSDSEVKALNNQLSRALGKKLLTQLAVGVVVGGVLAFVAHKLDK